MVNKCVRWSIRSENATGHRSPFPKMESYYLEVLLTRVVCGEVTKGKLARFDAHLDSVQDSSNCSRFGSSELTGL